MLQRVLRHNLRNEMNVVLGMAEEIREATADPRVDHGAARIADHTETLLRVSEKARTAAAVLDDQRPDEVIDATETVRAVVEPRRTRFPAATFDLDLPPSLPVSVGPKLAQALANVVENALEHTPEDVTVRIEAKRCENDATLRVSDDGDGIPKSSGRLSSVTRTSRNSATAPGWGCGSSSGWSNPRAAASITTDATGGAPSN